MDHLIGQTLGRYQINKLLGKGGMGAVFKAHHLDLERDVAIKLMNPEYAPRQNFIEFFRREARAAARMDHPGIVKVHDFGEALDHLYLVMEFIPGVNLRQMLQQLTKEKRWITQAEGIQIVRDSAYALAYAHGMHVLHRDIKPANIMVKEQKVRPGVVEAPIRPVITDLGLAKIQDSGLQSAPGTTAGGTPAYMSPEQALGRPLDGRSDVYSLGVLLFELTLGERPYSIHSVPEAVYCHMNETLPKPSSLRSDLDPILESILETALAKEAQDRYESAEALGDALQAIDLASLATSVPPSAANGSIELVTLHRQNLEQSPMAVTPSPQHPSGNQGSQPPTQIRIMQPDHSTYTIAFTREMIRIGRGHENDVVLNDYSVSRYHALVERTGRYFRIVDQGSANGLTLGQRTIGPHRSALWMPEEALRIGNHLLFLQTGDESVLSENRQGSQPVPDDSVKSYPLQQPDDMTGTLVNQSALRQPTNQNRRSYVNNSNEPDESERSLLPWVIGVMLLLFVIAGGYLVSSSGVLNRLFPESTSVIGVSSQPTFSAVEANSSKGANGTNNSGGVDGTQSTQTAVEVAAITATVAFTLTQYVVPTETPIPTNTPTFMPGPTQTPTSTAVPPTTTPLPTSAPKIMPTAIIIATPTNSPTVTETPTPTLTYTPAVDATATSNAERMLTIQANQTATAIAKMTLATRPFPEGTFIPTVTPDIIATTDAISTREQAILATQNAATVATATVAQPAPTQRSLPSDSSQLEPPPFRPQSNEVEIIGPDDGISFDQQYSFHWQFSEFASREVRSAIDPNSNYLFELVVFDNDRVPKGMTSASKRMSLLIKPDSLRHSPFKLESGKSYEWTVQLVWCAGGLCNSENYRPVGEVAPRRSFIFRPSSSGGSSGSSSEIDGNPNK
ncbi:MAG: FHA domain-containing serine/threonine-protein kinase [Chloroflexota bacterium]